MVRHKNKRGRGGKKFGRGGRGKNKSGNRGGMTQVSFGRGPVEGNTDEPTIREESNSSEDNDSDGEPAQGGLLEDLGSRIDTNPELKEAYVELAVLIEARAEETKKNASRRNPFFCEYCDVELVNRANYHEHILKPWHIEKLESHLSHMAKLIEKFCCIIQNSAMKAMTESRPVYMCRKCLLPHEDIPTKHRLTMEHRLAVRLKHVNCSQCSLLFSTILEYERHLSSLRHKRNHCKKFSGKVIFESDRFLPNVPGNYKEPIGSHYIYDCMGFHCTACNVGFRGSNKQYTLSDHCKLRDHFYNYRSFVEKRTQKPQKRKNPMILLVQLKPFTHFSRLTADDSPFSSKVGVEVEVNGKVYMGEGTTEYHAKFAAARNALQHQITDHSSDVYRRMCELAKATGSNASTDKELMELIQSDVSEEVPGASGKTSSSSTVAWAQGDDKEKDPFVADLGDENDMEDS